MKKEKVEIDIETGKKTTIQVNVFGEVENDGMKVTDEKGSREYTTYISSIQSDLICSFSKDNKISDEVEVVKKIKKLISKDPAEEIDYEKLTKSYLKEIWLDRIRELSKMVADLVVSKAKSHNIDELIFKDEHKLMIDCLNGQFLPSGISSKVVTINEIEEALTCKQSLIALAEIFLVEERDIVALKRSTENLSIELDRIAFL